MCKVFKVSRSGYYYWVSKQPSQRLLRHIALGISIKKIYDWSNGHYGSPRIAKELQMQGIKVSRPLVARIMRKKNLKSVTMRRFKQTPNSKHNYGIILNKLGQNFKVERGIIKYGYRILLTLKP